MKDNNFNESKLQMCDFGHLDFPKTFQILASKKSNVF